MIISIYDQRVLNETYAAVLAETGFGPEDLKSRRRTSELVIARFIALYSIRKHSRLNLKTLGREFGRDHSSIIHALHEVDKWLTAPNRYISEYIQLKKISETVGERMQDYLAMTQI